MGLLIFRIFCYLFLTLETQSNRFDEIKNGRNSIPTVFLFSKMKKDGREIGLVEGFLLY